MSIIETAGAKQVATHRHPILADVVSQHAEEAAFLWTLRGVVSGAPHGGLTELARFDERVDAHLDGLRVAGDAGWTACAARLEGGGAGEVFAAAALAMGTGDMARLAAVVSAVKDETDAAAGLTGALTWMDPTTASGALGTVSGTASPAGVIAALEGAAAHQLDPGHLLAAALTADSASVRAAALVAAGRLGRQDLLEQIRRALGDDDASVRFAAALACVLLGDDPPLVVLRRLAEEPNPVRHDAAVLAMRAMATAQARPWHRDLARDPAARRVAVLAAGASGDPALVPWLLEAMQDGACARVAGDAFALICGVDLVREALECDPPAGVATGPSDDPADEDVVLDPDDRLPWPDAARVAAWWRERQPSFAEGTRHLLGRPLDARVAREVLETGRQRQRAVAAIDLVLAGAGPLFDVRAPSHRQRRALAASDAQPARSTSRARERR